MPTTQQRDADFLKDLNLIPHPRDEQKTESEAFDSADIALFADTDFFDFPDIGTVFQASKEDQLDRKCAVRSRSLCFFLWSVRFSLGAFKAPLVGLGARITALSAR